MLTSCSLVALASSTVFQMKSFGNVFSLTGTVLAMIVESICCWRVSQSGATRPGHRRKGRLAPKTPSDPTHHGCSFHNDDERRITWALNRFDLLHLSRFTQYQRMVSNLAQCEFSMGKTLMVYDMNLREMENYEKIYKNIGMTLLGAAFHSSSNTWILLNFCKKYQSCHEKNASVTIYSSHCRTKHHFCTWEDCRMQKGNTEGKKNTKKSPR